jgi:pyruvate/2-oxoglutarate dehydrogenase complex dihydrolipoamide acyltransferase (E2) component
MADVTLPQLGETVTEGTITQWFKQVGDTVAADEPLFEVSTDKVDTEVPSPVSGVLTEIRVQEGDTVDVGTVIAVVGDADGAAAEAPAPPKPPAAEAEPAPEAAPEPAARAGTRARARARPNRRRPHRHRHPSLRLPLLLRRRRGRPARRPATTGCSRRSCVASSTSTARSRCDHRVGPRAVASPATT